MTTAEETRAVLRRYAERWQAGDVDALLAAYADDVVFHYFGTTDIAGTHHGKEVAVEAMIAASTRAPRQLRRVVDVLAGDELGALVVEEELARDGETAVVRRVMLYRVDGDRIAECWVLDEDQPLIDRFWRP